MPNTPEGGLDNEAMNLADYKVPDELAEFVHNGFLELLAEKPDEKTLEFHIPAMRYQDERGTISSFELIWIHPDYNAQFCHLYQETPGDLANSYLRKDTSDRGGEDIDIEDLDGLICWLDERRQERI